MSNKDEELEKFPDWMKKIVKSKYSGQHSNEHQLQFVLADVDERLRDLEYKTNRHNKREKITRAQKMLLLKELGMLDAVKENTDLTTGKLASLLSLVIDEDSDNIEGDLSVIQHRDSKLKTKDNYSKLMAIYKRFGLKNSIEKADKILDDINKKVKDKK